MGKITWTKEQEDYLENLYSQYLPMNDIVKKMNSFSGINRTRIAISTKAVQLGLTKKYIKPNNARFKAIYQDYDWCYDHYINQGLNHEEMAIEANCTKRVIEKWCQKKYHIDTYLRMKEKTLNSLQYDLIIGSLLGDGHIDRREEYPLFIVSHAENQKDYLYYKYEMMKDMCEMTPTKYTGKKQYQIVNSLCDCQNFYRFNTRTYYALKPFRDMSKSDLIQQLNAYSFSIWMLDDGHCNEDGAWELCVPLDTQEQRDFLKEVLKNKFGVVARQQADDRYFRFHINDSIIITDIIMKNIPHDLDIIKYKILTKPKYKRYKEVT